MTEAADGSTEAVDGLASKMQEDFSQIGVDITDANGQIRSTYDILTDVGAVWPSLTANQKAYYAELAAGKNQANIFIALMDNMKTAVAATATAYDSAGSAAEENAKKMDSIQGHLDKFRAAWEKFTTSFLDSQLVKNVIDIGTALVEFGTTDTGKAVLGLATLTLAFGKFKSVLSGLKEASGIGKMLSGLLGIGSVAKEATTATDAVKGLGKGAKTAVADTVSAGSDVVDVFANIRKGAATSGTAIEGVAAGAKGTTEAVAGLGTATTKAATSGGALSKALAAIGGPTTIGIGLAVAAIGGMVYAMDKASKATGKAQDQMVEDVKRTKTEYDNTTAGIKRLDDRAADLRTTIESIEAKDELTLVDRQNLIDAKRELSEIEVQRSRMERQQRKQKEENERATKKALGETNKISMFSGLGSLAGKDVTIPQEADELISAMSKLKTSYSTLDDASVRLSNGTLKKQQDELEATRQRMIDLRDQTEVGSAEYEMLSQKIDKATNYLDNTLPLMDRNIEATDKYGEALFSLGGKSTSVREVADNLNDLTTQYATGAISSENYVSQLKNGVQEMTTTTQVAGKNMSEILNISKEDFEGLSAAQQQEVTAATVSWQMYGDSLSTALTNAQSEFDATGQNGQQNFNTIKDSASGLLDMLVTQEGLQGNINDGFTGGSDAVRNYANNLADVITNMQSLSGAQDLVSSSSDLMNQIVSGNVNGMATSVWEGTEEGQQALSEFSSGAQESLQQIQDSNDLAWDTFKSTIEDSTSGAYDAVIDANGQLRDDISLTGDQAADVYGALASLLESDVPGAAEFAAQAIAQIGSKSDENLEKQASYNQAIAETGPTAEQAGGQAGAAFGQAGAAVDDAKSKTGLLGGAFGIAGSEGAGAGSTISGKFGEASGQIDGAKGSTDGLSGSLDGVGSSADGASGKVSGLSGEINSVPRFVEVVFSVVQNVTKKISEVFSGKGEATGSDYIHKTDAYMVGEEGPEIVTLPRGAGVANARETRNFRNMLNSGGRSGSGMTLGGAPTGLEQTTDTLIKAVRTLNTNVAALGTNRQTPSPVMTTATSAPKARASSYDDPHKQSFDSAYDEINYLQDMDRISEQDYLNRLENLNNSYFAGRGEYLEEYRKYEVEVYKGRKKLREQDERDQKQAEKDRLQAVKDGFKKEEDALEYMRDKDLITEDEYYRQLSALNDKYYKGKTDFLDEYQKYEIKVYDYLKKQEEQRLKDLKEQTEAQYDNTKDYIVDLIDKQIEAEEGKIDALEKEKDKQEELKKIEEARKKLAEAQSQKVRVYRAGQGFVYESDASAIEEASKELNDLLAEDEFEKQKQEIQDEVDRLEDLKDAWKDSLDINEDLEKYGLLMDWIKAFEEANYDDRLNMAEQFRDSYRKILAEIADAESKVSDTASTQLPNFKPSGAFATGTDFVQKSGIYQTGENGPELTVLPRGSGVLTADETKNMRAWGGISPVDLFSNIFKTLALAPSYTFEQQNAVPDFNFNNWSLSMETDSGLVDAIQNSLREAVIQYATKRDR